jgi:hypothetical protein
VIQSSPAYKGEVIPDGRIVEEVQWKVLGLRQKLWKDTMGLIKQQYSFRCTSSGAITASTLFTALSRPGNA